VIVAVDHVTVTIPPGEEAKGCHFYGRILGLTQVAKPPTLAVHGGAWFQIPDGRQLHLQSEDSHVGASRAHPAFGCDDLAGVASVLANAGYGVEWDTALAPRKRFYTSDPFGNRVEFLEKL